MSANGNVTKLVSPEVGCSRVYLKQNLRFLRNLKSLMDGCLSC